MKTVSLGLKELDFSCSREGHLSPSVAGTGLLCPRAAASIPNWEQWQPCSLTVFWRRYQRDSGLHPKKRGSKRGDQTPQVSTLKNSAAGLWGGVSQPGMPLLVMGVVWDAKGVLFWKICSSHNEMPFWFLFPKHCTHTPVSQERAIPVMLLLLERSFQSS